MTGHGKGHAQPERAQRDPQVLLRELQNALAITRCIRLAAEYGDDEVLDFADALAGLLILIEGAASLLGQQEVSP